MRSGFLMSLKEIEGPYTDYSRINLNTKTGKILFCQFWKKLSVVGPNYQDVFRIKIQRVNGRSGFIDPCARSN